MPTYEYACKSCGEHLEVVQSFADDALTTCPTCGGTLRKVFGNIGISFKGTGFYKNDSRSSTRSGSPGAGNGSEKSSESATPGAASPAKEAAPVSKESSSPSAPSKESGKPSSSPAPAAAS